MNKNITVLDMQNHVRGRTYIRRARGLVKKGRARFVDEHTIVLACPPEQSEDIGMDDTRFQTMENKAQEMAEQTEADHVQETAEQSGISEDAVLDGLYLVRKIDEIVNNTEYLTTALKQLEHLEGEAAAAAGRMIECRERTNQRMIEMLEKLMGKLTI